MDKELKFVEIKITVPEFTHMMQDVDSLMAKDNVSIHARPIRAIQEISKRLGKINILMAPADPVTDKNIFTSHNIASHISEWYSRRYGDRLKIHMGPGGVAIMIRGDAWKIDLPRIYGMVTAVCDPQIDKYKSMPMMSRGGPPPTLNILNCIENMTEQYASQLSRQELQSIATFFDTALCAFHAIENVASNPYITEALSDVGSAVHHIFTVPPHYGLSKWSTLQFIEKILKSYMRTKGIPFPLKHDLHVLSIIACKNGLQPLDTILIDKIKCDAGIRYGEQVITLSEAIEAHNASIIMAKIISMQF